MDQDGTLTAAVDGLTAPNAEWAPFWGRNIDGTLSEENTLRELGTAPGYPEDMALVN